MGSHQQAAAGKRADAARNIAAITDAALDLFSRDRTVSMADVARAAGVGRVTLYAHFPSREALLDAVLAAAIEQADRALDACSPEEGPADEAFARLVRSAWSILDKHRGLHVNALAELGTDRMRAGHAPTLGRVERLIARGQAEGVFRTDLPLTWLVTTVYSLLHAAAAEADSGLLTPEALPAVLETTLLAILRPPLT
ncbi:TetR/AcrR family transcriptional regulator [Longispora sp. NPDC051575]|uniref:TetR/AcrR family transcriptional regulator n=1 Tax=Longispora sp. NPDC051575 TaxID=3154943 RepID=UPI003434ACB9